MAGYDDVDEKPKKDEALRHKQWCCKHAFIPNSGNPICVHCGILHKDWQINQDLEALALAEWDGMGGGYHGG